MHAFFLAVLLLATGTMTAAWSAPTFCKGLDCPRYTVIKSLGDGVELRRYEPGEMGVAVKRVQLLTCAIFC